MEHRDCIIVYKSGEGIALRATRMTVENTDKMIIVYNGDDLMAIVPLDEVKTVIFADCGDAENIKAMIEAITAGQKTYAKGKPFEDTCPFAFHPDNVPEMICQRGEVTQMIKDDLISRQAAINQITKRFDDIQMLDWEKYPNAPFIQSGLLWSINTIRDLPSAQQKADVVLPDD